MKGIQGLQWKPLSFPCYQNDLNKLRLMSTLPKVCKVEVGNEGWGRKGNELGKEMNWETKGIGKGKK